MKNYFKSLFGVAALFLFTLSAVAQAPLQYRVDTIQGLLNVTLYGADAKVTAWVGGGTARDDGLGGVFFYDGNSAVSTNVYAVYKPVNNAGRWFKLPTQVAYQTAAVTVGDDTTYAWKLLRGGQTNFFGIGADNTTAYLQTFNGKTLQINNLGNDTILNATAGNVGIGTTTPAEKLDVRGNVRIEGSSNNYATLTYAESTGVAFAGNMLRITAGANGGAVSLGSNGADDRFILNSQGNVGIGQTTPAAKLDVAGTLLVGTSPVGQAIYGIYSAAAEIDFPPVIAQSVTNMTMTVTGAGTNSTVTVSSANGTVATANGLTFSAWVNATNTVTIRAANGTLDPWDPASSSYRVTVFQY